MIHLGVNIDHVATVRQARLGVEPDPVEAAVLADIGGASSITVHLRGDRRHIQDRDVRVLKDTVKGLLNLEMALEDDVLEIALATAPDCICLVPEKREELTTEGGLVVNANDRRLADGIARLQEAGCQVSLFIEPEPAALDAAKLLGADAIELHTGSWANAWEARVRRADGAKDRYRTEIERLEVAAGHAAEIGLRLHAGHGITYRNVRELLHLPLLKELNIGHSIVARAVLVGMREAVAEMRRLIDAGPV